jgi:hypothetical protein
MLAQYSQRLHCHPHVTGDPATGEMIIDVAEVIQLFRVIETGRLILTETRGNIGNLVVYVQVG